MESQNCLDYWPGPTTYPNYWTTYTIPSSRTPHKCPVCHGKGHVAAGFYGEKWSGAMLQGGKQVENCRSCMNGIVWG